LINIY